MAPSPVARRAASEDAPRLADIAAAAYGVYLPRLPEGVRPAPLDADYAAAIRDHEVWVALVGSSIAGYLVLIPAADSLLLENVAVDPGYQGTGVGRMLLGLAEERAGAHGVATIRLYTHAVMIENQRLYERLGYVQTERRRDGIFERVFYEKRL